MRCTPSHLARQDRLGELEHVIAGHIHHGRLDLRLAEFACGVEQAQFLDFLVRRQQVAFHTVGKKLQRALTLFACSHTLALHLQALGNPCGQGVAIDRVGGDQHAMVFQRGKPGPFARGCVQFGQHD